MRRLKHRGQQVKNSSPEVSNVWAAAIKECIEAFSCSPEPQSGRILELAQRKRRLLASSHQKGFRESHAEALLSGTPSLQSCTGTMRQACKLILLHALGAICNTGLPLPRTSARGAGEDPAIPTFEMRPPS